MTTCSAESWWEWCEAHYQDWGAHWSWQTDRLGAHLTLWQWDGKLLDLPYRKRAVTSWMYHAHFKVWWRRNEGLVMFFIIWATWKPWLQWRQNVLLQHNIPVCCVLPTPWQQCAGLSLPFPCGIISVHKEQPLKKGLFEFSAEEQRGSCMDPQAHWVPSGRVLTTSQVLSLNISD